MVPAGVIIRVIARNGLWTRSSQILNVRVRQGFGAPSGGITEISNEVLFHYRDGLIRWLDRFWSWLEDRLSVASTIEQVRTLFEAAAEEPELRPEWQRRLLENVVALHEFLGI